jgi:hypothetical protein
MTHCQRVNLVGWCLLLVTMLMAPGALPNQTTEHAPQQTAKTPAPATPSDSTLTLTTPVAPDAGCLHLNLPAEQIGDAMRSIDSTINRTEIERAVRQELRENLADLNERVRQEVQMSSPEMQRLQNLSAQLRINQGQVETSANELATRAA